MISIVIPTCHRADSLRACLSSRVNQAYDKFEVVVVQCEDDEETISAIDEYSQELSICTITQPGGLVSQMNAGLKKSRGEIFLRTDDDIVADKMWLSEIASTFQTGSDVGGVTGPTLIPVERLLNRDAFLLSPQIRSRRLLFRLGSSIYANILLEGQPDSIGRVFKSGAWSQGSNFEFAVKINDLIEVDYLEACNMAVRKSLIERAGGFDPSFKSIGEWSEMDLSFKIRSMGYRLCFNPKAIVNHMVSQSGIFGQRVIASDRMMNFLLFYFRHMKPNSSDGWMRFLSYLSLLQAYWMFKFISGRNLRYLGGLSGTLRGLASGIGQS